MELKFAECRTGHYPPSRVQSIIPFVVRDSPHHPQTLHPKPPTIPGLSAPRPCEPLHSLLFQPPPTVPRLPTPWGLRTPSRLSSLEPSRRVLPQWWALYVSKRPPGVFANPFPLPSGRLLLGPPQMPESWNQGTRNQGHGSRRESFPGS